MKGGMFGSGPVQANGTRVADRPNGTRYRENKPPWQVDSPDRTAFITKPGLVCRPGNTVVLAGRKVRVNPDWWFPNPSDSGAVALAVGLCGLCPAKDRCLELAIVAGEASGVWGGRLFEVKAGQSKTPLYDLKGRRVS